MGSGEEMDVAGVGGGQTEVVESFSLRMKKPRYKIALSSCHFYSSSYHHTPWVWSASFIMKRDCTIRSLSIVVSSSTMGKGIGRGQRKSTFLLQAARNENRPCYEEYNK